MTSHTSGERKASPLVFDKSKRVEPYRDPELLKRDEMQQRFAALQSQHRSTPQGGAPASAPPTAAPPPPSALPLPQASVSQLAAAAAAAQSASAAALPGLVNTTRPQALLGLSGFGAGGIPSLSAPLSLHHFTGSALDSAALSSLTVLQQQAAVAQLHQLQLLQAQQQPHLMPYAALQNSMQPRQLEVLWQQKYPNIPVPPGWILHQYQDELLRDVNPMLAPGAPQTSRDLLERRERELAAREREQEQLREMARDREHELREMREREDRERAERERIERDRAERDRQERDRQER